MGVGMAARPGEAMRVGMAETGGRDGCMDG